MSFHTPLLVGAIALAIGFTGGHKFQEGKVERAEAARDAARKMSQWNYDQALGWKAAKDACEANRNKEHGDAVDAANDAQGQCNTRIAELKRSRSALNRLLSKPVKLDAKGCPVESIIWAKDLDWGPGQ
jgi:hypothetical protein